MSPDDQIRLAGRISVLETIVADLLVLSADARKQPRAFLEGMRETSLDRSAKTPLAGGLDEATATKLRGAQEDAKHEIFSMALRTLERIEAQRRDRGSR